MQKTLFISEYFLTSVSTSMGIKKGHIYGKGALWGAVAPT